IAVSAGEIALCSAWRSRLDAFAVRTSSRRVMEVFTTNGSGARGPPSYHFDKTGLYVRSADLPLSLKFLPETKRFLRAHLGRGKRGVKTRTREGFPLRQTLAKKYGKAPDERVACTGGIDGPDLERRDELHPLLPR